MKILLADDNITAQKLGTKILSDAGYEVISVSNGAAAMKKIAAEKPHLLILDVFMPGYTGLEVCEKVKNSPDTSRVPVLLTVTNMEPFNPGEGNRVRADGVMIKPFEASDLLAVVQKLEKKLGMSPPKGKGSVDLDRAPEVKLSPPLNAEFKDASYEEWKAPSPPAPSIEDEEEPVTPKKQAPKIEMPHEVASSPVFGTDEIETPHVGSSAPGVGAPTPAGANKTEEFAVQQDTSAPDALPSVSGFVDEEVVHAAAISRHPDNGPAESAVQAPVETGAPSPEALGWERNSQPQAGAIEVAPAPELEVTAQESPREVNVAADPALVVNASAEITEFATKFGVPHPEEEPIGIVAAAPDAALDGVVVTPDAGVAFVPEMSVPSPDATTVKIEAFQTGAPGAGSDALGWKDNEPDQEVKPVMLAPEPAVVEAPITRNTTPQAEPELQQVGNNSGAYSFELEMRRAFAAGMSSAAAAAAPAVEAPAVEPVPGETPILESGPVAELVGDAEPQMLSRELVPEEVTERLAAEFVAEIEEADAGRAAGPDGHVEIVSEPELVDDHSNAAAITANDTAAIQAEEDERISQAVERVLNRYRPQLIADIVRELKG